MTRPIAVDGDTQIETSTAKHPSDGNQNGKWEQVSFTVTKGDKVSVNGKFVELSATAVWSYVGGANGTTPLPPVPDSATLTAGTTKLKDQSRDVLVDGDEATGRVDSGNKISVSASQHKLTTA